MRRAIVTGATGFLGYALLNELIENGIFVYALCRRNSSRLSRLCGLANVKVIEIDLDCADAVAEIERADVFYHLAWEGGRNDFEAQYKNIDMSVNCLKLAVKLGCKRFICTGSQAEYGETFDLITEETPLKPTTAYGACKVAACYLMADLAKRIDIEHIWVRVFSVYGPNDNSNTLIMSLISDLQAKGTASHNTDGTQIWNYLHEGDAARALRLIGQSCLADSVYNLASNRSKPLKEFSEDLRNIVNPAASIYFDSVKSYIHLNTASDKLRSEIGDYEHMTFMRGIEEMVGKRQI